jgi:hypothetical protein
LFIFHFIWMDVILPIDELHHFSRWCFKHQPGVFNGKLSINMGLSTATFTGG